MKIVQDNKSLVNLCKLLAKQHIIYLDTEFKRDKTYWPQLCTIQFRTSRQTYLLDMVDIFKYDLEKLKYILSSNVILKVIHSAKQDIEVLNYTFGIKVKNVFDTQLVYDQIFHTATIGYRNIVKNLLNINLSKKLQSSDWSQRPLNSKQLIYAENDVKYLPKIYLFLIHKIKKKRMVRMIKKMNLINTEVGNTFEPKLAYKRIKTKSVNRNQKMLIKKYAYWRELQAQKYDIPSNWVVSDKNLIRASKERFDDLLKNRKNKDQMLEQFKSYLKLKNFSQKGL